MLCDDIGYLIGVFLIFFPVLVKLQIKRIVEQIYLFLADLSNDTERLVVFLDKHINHFVRDFGLFGILSNVHVLHLELLIHGFRKLNVGIFRNVTSKFVVFG